MIETYTILDVTNQTARISIGSWGSGKVHSFDNEHAAKSRHTRIKNLFPKFEFGILKVTISDQGVAQTERIL